MTDVVSQQLFPVGSDFQQVVDRLSVVVVVLLTSCPVVCMQQHLAKPFITRGSHMVW